MSLVILYFFFFQAEDGIRDYKVTGVQTCALPISASQARASTRLTCSSDRGRTIQRGTRPSTAALTQAAVSSTKASRPTIAASAPWIGPARMLTLVRLERASATPHGRPQRARH